MKAVEIDGQVVWPKMKELITSPYVFNQEYRKFISKNIENFVTSNDQNSSNVLEMEFLNSMMIRVTTQSTMADSIFLVKTPVYPLTCL